MLERRLGRCKNGLKIASDVMVCAGANQGIQTYRKVKGFVVRFVLFRPATALAVVKRHDGSPEKF